MAITKTAAIEAAGAGANLIVSGSGSREFTIVSWTLSANGADARGKWRALDGSAITTDKCGLMSFPSGSIVYSEGKLKFPAGTSIEFVVSGSSTVGGFIEYSAKGSG